MHGSSAALLRTVAGEKPVVVVSDEASAHARIVRFARGGADAQRWLVAVSMVSEGVDVPRLVLAAAYPDEADRLRIPASLEAIDHRLGVATGED